MWIARDEDGLVCIYDTKPIKDNCEWILPNSIGGYSVIDTELDGFEEVKWSDEEPRELVLKPIKKE